MTFPLPVLLAPLVAGYAFAVVWNASYYHASREDGRRIYFRAAFYAFFLGVVAGLLHTIILCDWRWEWYRQYVALVGQWTDSGTDLDPLAAHPAVLLNTLPISVALGGLLSATRISWVVNMPGVGRVAWWWECFVLDHATRNMDFERLVTRAFRKSIPVLVTLTSLKVYAGWVVAAPSPTTERHYLRILPILSGYRDSSTYVTEFTTEYADALLRIAEGNDPIEHLDPDDLEVVMPVDQISNIHLFDLALYETAFSRNGGEVRESDSDEDRPTN